MKKHACILIIFLLGVFLAGSLQADEYESLRFAITDLMETRGTEYPKGQVYLDQLQVLESTDPPNRQAFESLRHTALTANPVLDGLKIICIKRAWPDETPKDGKVKDLFPLMGFPVNHQHMSSLTRTIYQNEIGIFEPSTGTYTTLYKPKGKNFVGHINLHWNADKLLFTEADKTNWKIFEIRIDGTGLRQVSKTPDDVDCYEPCYLPDGRIVFSSNAAFQCIPCWHGTNNKYAGNLFIMNSDGSGMRRLTFDQDHDFHPYVRHSGQVVYGRWDYTGINRIYNRPLMSMNPDGTSQRSIYGSNSWFPNGLYNPKELPGKNSQFLCVLAGYHGSYRSGTLALLDLNKGTKEDQGIVRQISGTGKPIPVQYRDQLTNDNWPEFVTPTPITDTYYLASAWQRAADKKIGIYLADRFDNVIPLFEEDGMALLEPIPLVARKTPPVIPDRINLDSTEATVFIQDLYAGPGLSGVPVGTVKNLRVIAYDFGYSGMAGMDKIGLSGPWEAMRILGTTPVEEDGSVIFKVPANTPIALQPLDEEGKAIQLMRTWMTAMPGETLSCVGCHESSSEVPLSKQVTASYKAPRQLEEWYGPARGFDFAREVQPVLNRYCVSCHDQENSIDLRPEEQVPDYAGRIPGHYDATRMHPYFAEKYNGKVLYTPAYEALLPYIRRVNVGDDVSLLEPGHYHADTSELVQLLKEGHHGIVMDAESWSRIVTWIDLNGPCHGTWYDVYNECIPGEPDKRRMESYARYGGPPVNPDLIPETPKYDETPVKFDEPNKPKARIAKIQASPVQSKTIDLGGGEKIELVNFGGGYWIGACEISNGQFLKFDPGHDSHYYTKRHEKSADSQGLRLDEPGQPVVRVSWNKAMEFCAWLSKKTGYEITLPSEKQWNIACRTGSAGAFYYDGEDFSEYENMADKTFATQGYKKGDPVEYFRVAGDCDLLVAEGVDLADRRFDDHAIVTQPIGSYKPNAFGLHDMLGNAAEWTLTDFVNGEKTVKGGSFLDRPARCGAEVRHGYPAWQSVHNVGFRIVVNPPETK